MPKHERCVSSSPKQHWPLLVSMLLQRRRTRGKAENARRFPRQLAAAFSMSSPLTNQTVAPLRFAPVGMTKGAVTLPFRFDAAEDEQQVPPLRGGLRFCWPFVSHYFACWSDGRCLPSVGRGTKCNLLRFRTMGLRNPGHSLTVRWSGSRPLVFPACFP